MPSLFCNVLDNVWWLSMGDLFYFYFLFWKENRGMGLWNSGRRKVGEGTRRSGGKENRSGDVMNKRRRKGKKSM